MKYWYGGSNESLQNVQQNTNDIIVEKCNISKHFGPYQELFSQIEDLNTFFCATPRLSNQTIYGQYGNIYPFGYYHFYVYMCLNQSESDRCYKNETIMQLLSNTYLEMRTVDYSINSLNTNKLLKTNIRVDRYMISLTVYKRIYLNWVQYITDQGFVFTSNEEIGFHQFDSTKFDIDHRDINNGTIKSTFVTMTFLGTGKKIVYNRMYVKLPEYIATISGIIKVITTSAFIINYSIGRNYYYMKFINSLLIKNIREDRHNTNSSKPTLFRTTLLNFNPQLEHKTTN